MTCPTAVRSALPLIGELTAGRAVDVAVVVVRGVDAGALDAEDSCDDALELVALVAALDDEEVLLDDFVSATATDAVKALTRPMDMTRRTAFISVSRSRALLPHTLQGGI